MPMASRLSLLIPYLSVCSIHSIRFFSFSKRRSFSFCSPSSPEGFEYRLPSQGGFSSSDSLASGVGFSELSPP
jgi:hypothetical protein